jgi:hypothetical protein
MGLILSIVIPLFMLPPLPQRTGYYEGLSLYEVDDTKQAVVALLRRAPNLKPLPENALDEDEFVSLSRIVASKYPKKHTSFNSVVDAVAFLESLIKPGTDRGSGVGWPKATITSEPSGWSVKYLGYVDHVKGRGVWQDISTNASVFVEPKMYIFKCSKNDGDPCGEKVISCATNCKVSFP